MMDHHVLMWLTRPHIYPRRRDLLALKSYSRLEKVAETNENLDQDVVLFLQETSNCQVIL